jgi:hypothetical protein
MLQQLQKKILQKKNFFLSNEEAALTALFFVFHRG